MEETLRILHVIGAMDRGGAETMIMNLYRQIDRRKYQFDFLVHTDRKCDYDEEIYALGGRIFRVPYYVIANYFSYAGKCRKLIEEHPEWKIIHGHIASSASVYLRVARKLNRFTIAHSHKMNQLSSPGDVIHKIMTYDNRWIADYYMACSRQAGLDRYGKKIVNSDRFQVLNNGIDAPKYCFDPKERACLREKMQIGEELVVGHVGRFVKIKNHEFLLDVFREILLIKPNAKLVLVGRGPLEATMKHKTEEMGMEKNVFFLGVCDNIPEILNMIDVFVFPSFYEGLGIAAIEAQAAGLPCVMSSTIPDEAVITADVKKMELTEKSELWAKTIIKMAETTERKNTLEDVRKAGFDIGSSVKKLVQVYDNAVKNIK